MDLYNIPKYKTCELKHVWDDYNEYTTKYTKNMLTSPNVKTEDAGNQKLPCYWIDNKQKKVPDFKSIYKYYKEHHKFQDMITSFPLNKCIRTDALSRYMGIWWWLLLFCHSWHSMYNLSWYSTVISGRMTASA